MKNGSHAAPLTLRPARADEIDLLRHMHVASLWCVAMRDHLADDVAAFLRAFPTVDLPLVAAGRYFVAELGGHIVAGGGWAPTRETVPADVAFAEVARFDAILPTDSAFVRGFFVAGGEETGVARLLMQRIEADAARAGFPLAIVVTSRAAAMAGGSPSYRDIRPLPLVVAPDRVLSLLQLTKRIGADLAAVA